MSIILSVSKAGTYGIIVSRWSMGDDVPAWHHVESIRAGEYWLVRRAARPILSSAKGL